MLFNMVQWVLQVLHCLTVSNENLVRSLSTDIQTEQQRVVLGRGNETRCKNTQYS